MTEQEAALQKYLGTLQQKGEATHGKEKFDRFAQALVQDNPNGMDPVEMQRVLRDPNAADEFYKRGRDAMTKQADDDPMVDAQLRAIREAERAEYRKSRGR